MSISYTYESNTMYLYTLIVHCTLDITQVEHICVNNEVFSHCSLSLYSARYLFLTFMKAIRCICTH